MKSAAVIAEFNPFHNGHKYLIDTVRKEYGVDFIVAFMSGDFTQRGEPAIYDKYTRTGLALKGGADVVFELPSVYAASAAPDFSYGGVFLANALSSIDYLAFGSECGDIGLLKKTADILLNEPQSFSELVKSGQKSGKSYALALSEALKDYCGSDVLDNANNMLGVQYIKTLTTLNSRIEPVTIKRFGNEHNSKDSYLDSSTGVVYESASCIREKILRDNVSESSHMSLEDFALPVFDKLRSISVNELSQILGSDADNSARIIKASLSCSTIQELIDKASHKQNTRASVTRVLAHLLLDIKADSKKEPSCIRLLGMKKSASSFMKLANESSSVNIITKAADYRGAGDSLFDKDLYAADLYERAKSIKYKTEFRPDITKTPVII